MKFSAKVFCLFLTLEGVKGFLTDVEWDMVLRLIEKYHVNRVILAPEVTPPEIFSFVKTLSEKKITWGFSKRENLKKYLKNPDFKIFPWTAIVLKERDLKSVSYLDDPSIIPSFFWLLFDGSNGTLRREVMDVYIPINTGFFLIEKLSPDHYVLSECYQIKVATPGVVQACAEWKNNDLYMYKSKWYDRKSNFHGYELNTVKFVQDLYLTPKEKINEAIWKELSLLLNFTINQKLIEYSPNNGSVELVKEEDEALLDTAIYIGNTKKFRYLLGPTSQSKIYMHVKAEGEYKGLTRFLMPFSKSIWWSIGLWICCCATFFCFVEYFSRKLKLSDNLSEGWYYVALIPLDSLCNQCGANFSRNLTSRLMFLLIKSSSFVIFHSYGAIFISYLLLYIPQLPFVDLKGFVEDGTFKIIGERNSDVDAFFNVSVIPLEKLIYKKFLVDTTKWERLDKEIDRMCAGEKLVLVAYDNDVDKYKPCKIVKIKKPLKIVRNGFKIRYKSPFRGLLHIKLLLLRSSGVLKKLNNEIPRNTIYKGTRHRRSDNDYKVTLGKISSAFFLLVSGYLLSAVILLIEVVVKKFLRKQTEDFINKRRQTKENWQEVE